MAEYIEREAMLKSQRWGRLILDFDREAAREVIASQPAADVAPVVHGRNLNAEHHSLFECSVCHWSDGDTYTGDTSTYNYCPNCGAKMDGGKNDAD